MGIKQVAVNRILVKPELEHTTTLGLIEWHELQQLRILRTSRNLYPRLHMRSPIRYSWVYRIHTFVNIKHTIRLQCLGNGVIIKRYRLLEVEAVNFHSIQFVPNLLTTQRSEEGMYLLHWVYTHVDLTLEDSLVTINLTLCPIIRSVF